MVPSSNGIYPHSMDSSCEIVGHFAGYEVK